MVQAGLIGAYTSAAVASDGTVWIAGYLEANWNPANPTDGDTNFPYGDLVVGTLDANGEPQWKVVDGTDPNETADPQKYDPTGFRDGKINPGDDVGLWTSIALDGDGNPGVAYYDVTHHALKYAHAGSDGTWTITTVKAGATGTDYGAYAKLAFVNGAPTIAFHFVEPSDMGLLSGVRLATGADTAGSSWSFEDVVSDNSTPCKANLCAGGKTCLTTGACAAASNMCMGDCGSGKACVDDGMGGGTCAKTADSGTPVTYPNEVGLYVAMVPDPSGMHIAYYDRPKGNVVLATKTNNGWQSIIVDGNTGMTKTADKGIGLSLAMDGGGVLHLSYVDGLTEALDYAMVKGGVVQPSELVDDGMGAGEGHHVVGDDSNVYVAPSGEVRISYMDATTGKLWLAIGTPNGMAHTWKPQALAQDGFAGWFSRQLQLPNGGYRILNWWRVGNPAPIGNVRLVAPM